MPCYHLSDVIEHRWSLMCPEVMTSSNFTLVQHLSAFLSCLVTTGGIIIHLLIRLLVHSFIHSLVPLTHNLFYS